MNTTNDSAEDVSALRLRIKTLTSYLGALARGAGINPRGLDPDFYMPELAKKISEWRADDEAADRMAAQLMARLGLLRGLPPESDESYEASEAVHRAHREELPQ